MVILRGLPDVVDVAAAPQDVASPGDNALGDWYVRRLPASGASAWLLTSAASMLCVLVPADSEPFDAEDLCGLVGARLLRLGVELNLIGAELASMRPVRVGGPCDEAVVARAEAFSDIVTSAMRGHEFCAARLRRLEDRLAGMRFTRGQATSTGVTVRRRALQLLEDRWAIRDRVIREHPGHEQAAGPARRRRPHAPDSALDPAGGLSGN